MLLSISLTRARPPLLLAAVSAKYVFGVEIRFPSGDRLALMEYQKLSEGGARQRA
jgi:hypothetical protein